MSFRLLSLISVLLAAASAIAQDKPVVGAVSSPLHRIAPPTPQDLQDLLQYTGKPLPLVSAHRGGPAQGFPENCIATFEHTLQHTFAFLEIDPRYAKDGTIVVHHDAQLERTTTGKGLVADFTCAGSTETGMLVGRR